MLSHVAYELHIAVIRIETFWNVSLFLFASAPCHCFVLNFFLSYDASSSNREVLSHFAC